MRERSNGRYEARSYQGRSGTNRAVVGVVLGVRLSSSSIRSAFDHSQKLKLFPPLSAIHASILLDIDRTCWLILSNG